MKRDLSLIRNILLSIEQHDKVDVECEDDILAQHILLLNERNFVKGIVAQEVLNGPPVIQQTMSYVRLTSAGHDYLNAVRDEGVWKKTVEKIGKLGGGVTLEIVVAIATEFIKEKLGMGG